MDSFYFYFEKNVFLKAIVLFSILISLFFCSTANGSINLTVNGNDPTALPLELESGQSVKINLVDLKTRETSYDLTLSVTGGIFHEGKNESVHIQTSDLALIDSISFEFQDDSNVATISLKTNQSLICDKQIIPANTEIYQLILFGMPVERTVVFGIDFQSLSYESTAQKNSLQSAELQSFESTGLGDGDFIMMSTSHSLPEPVWFDNPKQCPDFDYDNFVNYIDYSVFAENWLKTGSDLAGDFDEDGVVDVNDLTYFCQYWFTPVYHPDSQPYLTSFEYGQGFTEPGFLPTDPNNIIDGWLLEEGSAEISEGALYTGTDTSEIYHYLSISGTENATVTRTGESPFESINQIFRINCIPAAGCAFSVQNGEDMLASIYFDPNTIYVWNPVSQIYTDTAVAWKDIADSCRERLNNGALYWNDPNYSYENTWISFTIELDLAAEICDVYWEYFNYQTSQIVSEVIITGIPLRSDLTTFTQVCFESDGINFDNSFLVNRFSASNETGSGGIVGEDEDIWITTPIADKEDPIEGSREITGSVWYDRLGEYIIRCCRAEEYSETPGTMIIDGQKTVLDPWMIVSRSGFCKRNKSLGDWNSFNFQTGSYYLKIEVYDDLGRFVVEHIVKKEMFYNGTVKSKNAEYTLLGRGSGTTYHFDEHPDVQLNWPGSFPFEMKRSYNDRMASTACPLFFGWTHNHNIRLIENCAFNWQINEQEKPIGDRQGIGVGQLWLMEGAGCRMFEGQIDSQDPDYVIYTPDDKEPDYITRRVTNVFEDPDYIEDPNVPMFQAEYIYYSPDGRRYIFDCNTPLSYEMPADEGIVDWTISGGIRSQEDRFGNALMYHWQADPNKTMDLSVDKIYYEIPLTGGNTQRTGISMELYSPQMPLYKEIRLFSQTLDSDGHVLSGHSNAVIMFQILYDSGTYYYQYTKVDPGYDYDLPPMGEESGYKRRKLTYETEKNGQIVLQHVQIPYETIGNPKFVGSNWIDLYRNPDQSLQNKVHQFGSSDNDSINTESDYLYSYQYEQEANGNFIIYLSYKTANEFTYEDEVMTNPQLIRTEKTIQSPNGAVLCQTIVPQDLYTGSTQNPFDYQNSILYFNNCRYALDGPIRRIDGGGYIEKNYKYEDERFPYRATALTESFDDDGDGLFDRPDRITTFQYDERGNLTEQRVYLNDASFVLTRYEYHVYYNFPTRKTAWQNYCMQDEYGNALPYGPRTEEQWVYGNQQGNVLGTGDQRGRIGDFLVEKRTLLNDQVSPEQWAVTSYVYNSTGQAIMTTDPENHITCSTYDERGFVSCVWTGAQLDGNNEPIGDPQQRYYFNPYGFMELKADYLGKVTMYLRGGHSWILEERIYRDPDAVNLSIRTGFIPHFYDSDPYSGGDGSLFQSKTVFSDYTIYDQYVEETLPYGKTIQYDYDSLLGNIQSSTFKNDCGWCDYIRDYYNCNDLLLNTDYSLTNGYDRFTHKTDSCRYNAVDQLIHKYEYWYESPGEGNDYILFLHSLKHTFCQYDASGNKLSEDIYQAKGKNAVDPIPFDDPDTYYGAPLHVRSVWYEYDELDRLIRQIQDPEDQAITIRYDYNAAGNKSYTIDPEDNVIFNDYDNANRKIREYYPAPAVYFWDIIFDPNLTRETAALRTETEYFDNDKIKSIRRYDYDGETLLELTEFAYDDRNRIENVWQLIKDNDADGQINAGDEVAQTTYEYADDGSLVTGNPQTGYHIVIHDAMNKQTGIRLNYHGKPVLITYPSGDYEEYTFYDYSQDDPNSVWNGLLETKTVWDSSGNPHSMTYEYDEYGKLSKIIYPGNDGSIDYQYTWRVLGDHGLVSKITDNRSELDNPGPGGSAMEFEYCGITQKPIRHIDQDGIAVCYDYNLGNNQKSAIDVYLSENQTLYSVRYDYDLAGRLRDVNDLSFDSAGPIRIAGLDYDANGNRDLLTYYFDGAAGGNTYTIDYESNRNNQLTSITTALNDQSTSDYYFDASGDYDIDGLGRLRYAAEAFCLPQAGVVSHLYEYGYNMRSELTAYDVYNPVPALIHTCDYQYDKAGNITQKTVDMVNICYGFTGDLMTDLDGQTLDWDNNGQLTTGPTDSSFDWNWDGKLRSAVQDSNSIAVKYDPMGNRVWRQSSNGIELVMDKYVVDISGSLPVILCVLDGNDPNILKSSYFYADAQILTAREHAVDPNFYDEYWYVHDRLGSIRQVMLYDAQVPSLTHTHTYAYTPFGADVAAECYEDAGAASNPWKFAGQWCDAEIGQYFLRARMYDPAMMRFTSRDPIVGKRQEPLTLHKYLYCLNSPCNRVDPAGKFSFMELLGSVGTAVGLRSQEGGKVAAGYAATQSLISGASLMNGITQGYINSLFGPEDVSDKAKFLIGFVAGYGEMQISLRTGSATAGATAASLFTSAANAFASESTDFFSAGTLLSVGFAAVTGGLGDYVGGDALDALHFWAIGVDSAMGSGIINMAYEEEFGD